MSTIRDEFNLDGQDLQLGITPIRAIRAWQLRGPRSWNPPMPASLAGLAYSGFYWTPGENVADCPYKGGYAPEWMVLPPHTPGGVVKLASGRTSPHQCGMYAYHAGTVNTFAKGYRNRLLVEGVIEAYGRVTLHSRGLRCEKARIVALVPDAQLDGESLDVLTARYPVPFYPTLGDALTDFPLERAA